MHRLQGQSAILVATVRRFLLLFVVGFTLLLLGLLLFSPLFDVREIRVLRTDARIDIEQVQHALLPVFHRHLFFLSSQDIAPLLQSALPDLTDVSVQKRYPSTIVLRLTLDPIIARLSIEGPEGGKKAELTAKGTGALLAEETRVRTGDFLTAQGKYVVYQAAQVQGTNLSTLRVVDWGVRPVPQTRLMDPAFLLLLRETEQALREQFGQEVIERTVFLRAQEFHLRIKNIALWFDRRSSLEDHLQRYRIFLRTVGLPAAKQYIDLRLADRVVYK